MGNSVRRSPTALDQFEKCERQFYYQRVAKLPEVPSPHLSVGILYHAAIENMIAGYLDLRLLLSKHKSRPDWCDPGCSDEDLMVEIVRNLEKVAELREQLPVAYGERSVPLVEQWGKRYSCKIDYVSTHTPILEEGRVVGAKPGQCVLDWKTVGGARRRSASDAENSAQLALYCIETGSKAAAFVELPRKGGPVNVVLVEFDEYTLRRWEVFLEAQFFSMNSRGQDEREYKLAPRGHPLCSPRFCSFWDRCEGGGNVRTK